MAIPQTKLFYYNRAGELEAEIETTNVATVLEFAADFRDADGFIQLKEIQGGWAIIEPTPAQSTAIQKGAQDNAAAAG